MGACISCSLKNRIALVAGLLFLLGISLIAVFVSRILHADMQEILSKQQQTTTNYIARDIDAKIRLRLDSLQRVASNIPSQLFANPARLQPWLNDRQAIHTLFPAGLMIIPPDGGPTLAEVPRLPTRPKSFVDRDWFIGATTTGRAFISKPLITRATGEPALVIAIPLFDRQQRLLGVLAGITPLATPGFLDLIIGTRPGKQGNYQLVAAQHQLFALSSESQQSMTPLPQKGIDPLLDLALSGVRGIKLTRNARNEEELATIADIPLPGWFLLTRQPVSDIYEPVNNTWRNTLLITLVLAIPLVLLLLAALSRLLQPFAHLADELHAMADGTRPMHPLKMDSTDEVADVAESFNRLQSKLLEQEQRLKEMAHHDALTGLPNRLTIMDRLENELLHFQRHTQGLALLFLDLDGFKPVNDLHGHAVGDLLLIEIAHRLKASVRDIDTVARLGGDEFLILLSATEAPLEAAERVAQQCIQTLQTPLLIAEQSIAVGVSIGIAITDSRDPHPASAAQLVSFADAAMYQAKADGRNRYAIHTAVHTRQKEEYV